MDIPNSISLESNFSWLTTSSSALAVSGMLREIVKGMELIKKTMLSELYVPTNVNQLSVLV